MHVKKIEVGVFHADLWEELVVMGRWVSGPHDITVGDHPALGRCTVSHNGLEDQIVWITERPVSEPV